MEKPEERGLHNLIKQLAAGSSEALAEIWKHEAKRLFWFIRKRFNELDEQEIDAIIQEVMIVLLQKAYQYSGSSDKNAKNYISTIAYRIAMGLVKKKAKLLYWADDLINGYLGKRDPHVRDLREAEDLVAGGEVFGEVLESLVKVLTDRERTAFELKARGYIQTEIAQMMGVSRSRVSQLMRSIREKGETIL